MDELRAASVAIQQRVMRRTEQLAEARVVAAFVGRDGRPQRQPESWMGKFREIANQS
jgi:acyl-CoA thioesterase FadM